MQLIRSTHNTIYAYLVDATDGFTPEVDVTTPTIYLSKAGGAAAVPADGTWTQIASTNMPGWYSVLLDSVDSNTVGALAVDVIEAGTSRHFAALHEVMPYDGRSIRSDTIFIRTLVGTLGVAINTTTIQGIASQTWDVLTAVHTVVGSTGKAITASGSTADPWATDLESAYTGSQAGNVIARVVYGVGRTTYTVTVEDDNDVAVEGVTVDVWKSTTLTDTNYVTTGTTDSLGQITFYLPSTFTGYLYKYKKGYKFTNPTYFEVS